MILLGLNQCPCCRFYTLEERGIFDICRICWWEDDGQDDHNADEVTGGPNGAYSLSVARENFLDHGDMYFVDDGIEFVRSPSPERKHLIDYVIKVVKQEIDLSEDLLSTLLTAEEAAGRAG